MSVEEFSSADDFLVVSPTFTVAIEACRDHFIGPRSPPPARREWPGAVALSAFARRHRIEALVAGFLGTSRDPAAPRPDGLFEEARRIAHHGLLSATASATLRDAFAAAEIDVVFIKGLAVAALAYRDPFVKMSWDIDILVAENDVTAAAETFKRLGYRLVFPAFGTGWNRLQRWHRRNKESTWANDAGLFVELHSRLADNQGLIASIGMRSPRQRVTIASGLTLDTLASAQLFAYLCVHGASSAWFRLKWAADLAGLLNPLDGAAIERLYREAEVLGARRPAAQALLVIHRLFVLPLEPAFVRELMAPAAHRCLAAMALRELAAPVAPTERRFGTARIHVSQLLLRPGARFALGEAARQVRAAIANQRAG